MHCSWRSGSFYWDYDNPHLRMLYVDRTYQRNGEIVWQALTKLNQRLKLRQRFQGRINISILGCGPAPELISVQVSCYLWNYCMNHPTNCSHPALACHLHLSSICNEHCVQLASNSTLMSGRQQRVATQARCVLQHLTAACCIACFQYCYHASLLLSCCSPSTANTASCRLTRCS